jgi:uncharacterized membrane protein
VYSDEIEPAAAEEDSYIKGLNFPNRELVNYWDFLCFSFNIAMCYSRMMAFQHFLVVRQTF